MKTYKGYLIDLDGTMYRGNESIEAASDFVKALQKRGIPYLFVTNNSSKKREQVAEKLVQLDIPATPEHVFTTSMATATYIVEKRLGTTVYVIGEEGLLDAVNKEGLQFGEETADVVVVGIDRGITYEKLAKGCLAIRNGATFMSTNPDVAIPTERGLLPGNGSLTALLSTSTGRQPTFIGKPGRVIIDQALEVLGTKRGETLMVGDNYDTDILAGIRAGIDTLLVHTGVTTRKQLLQCDIQPTYTVGTLAEWEPF